MYDIKNDRTGRVDCRAHDTTRKDASTKGCKYGTSDANRASFQGLYIGFLLRFYGIKFHKHLVNTLMTTNPYPNTFLFSFGKGGI